VRITGLTKRHRPHRPHLYTPNTHSNRNPTLLNPGLNLLFSNGSNLNLNSQDKGGLSTWFKGLEFGQLYDVRITSRRGTWDGDESSFASRIFTMPSCLKAHNYRFDKCGKEYGD
jgi:hypothetical protein